MRGWSFICSVIAHLLLVLVILGLSSWFKPHKPPELLPLELELVDAPAVAQQAPPVQEPAPPEPPKQEEETPPEPEPEPEPETPPPEPEPEPPPKEEKPPVVKVDKPKPPEVKPPETPKPKPPTREEQMRQRMEEARKKNSRTIKQPETPKPDNSRQKDITRTLEKFANSSKGVSIPNASRVAGVSAAQMDNYQRYMARCVIPMLDGLWQMHGPDGLGGNVAPVVIDFYVAPSGAVQSCVVSASSDDAQMNAAAQRLVRDLTQRGLPPFSTVGLSTERNASLPIRFTLKYAR